jgi:hypothetical protein
MEINFPRYFTNAFSYSAHYHWRSWLIGLQVRILHRKSCLFMIYNISISIEEGTKLNNENVANYVAV